MYRPLSLFIGLRYLRAKKRSQFISIISAISFVGISLGVAVLITVMSIMNGFDEQIKERILMMVPPIKVYEAGGKLYDWQTLGQTLQQSDISNDIKGISPIIEGQGLLAFNGRNAFAEIQGISSNSQNGVVPIAEAMVAGNLFGLKPGKFNIVLGKFIAQSLGIGMGDKITVIVPQADLTPTGMIPRLRQFTVSGIFSVSYQYDSYYALIDIADAAKLFCMGDSVSALQIGMKDIYQAPYVKRKLNCQILTNVYQARDWSDENKSFFQALQMEKTMMFFILLLIIAVAIFNLLSSLVMIVTDKNSDIAILRTLGMPSRQIIMIFIIQGLTIGLIGTFIGVLLGVFLSLNATEIINWIQVVFNVQFLSPCVYQIDFVPSKLIFSDVLHIAISTFILSFLATLYPASRAASIEPSEALRYE